MAFLERLLALVSNTGKKNEIGNIFAPQKIKNLILFLIIDNFFLGFEYFFIFI